MYGRHNTTQRRQTSSLVPLSYTKMLPEFVCNLTATLPRPPWRKGIDWDLHTTKEWEQRIPFCSYVKLCAVANRQAFSFPQFTTLPAELQIHILAFCSASTLFQVMRVSSTLRVEASKLFWTISSAFFLIEARWLLDGGYPGYTSWDVPFLHHVQKVEIEYLRETRHIICPQDDGIVSVQWTRIKTFWESFMQRFPNAKQVVINQNWDARVWWEGGTERVSQPLQMLIQSCPPGIEVAAFVLEENLPLNTSVTVPPTKRWQRSLYQLAVDGRWAKVDTHWNHTTILMPTKSFSGPVGKFQKIAFERDQILCQKHGLWPLMIEALDRYHFDSGENKPFTCPCFGCNAYFLRAGEWTVHAAESHCQEWRAGEPIAFLPDDLRVVFEEQEKSLDKKQENISRDYQRICDSWNKEGEQMQERIERSWMEQLENDAAWSTEKIAKESKLWKDFLQHMDPTWEGYY
jgi:hypothetical protein